MNRLICRYVGYCCVLALLASGGYAKAQALREATIRVEAGWGGRVRPGAWNPVLMTVSARKPTTAILRIDSPHDAINSMSTSVRLTVTAEPERYTFVVPLTYGLNNTTATLTDARTGNVLDKVAFAKDDAELNPYSASSELLMAGETFVGVSGDEGAQRMLSRQFDAMTIKSGYLAPASLPTSATGYDALDALVLADVNLVTLGTDQQQAIVDWVRAGGVLVIWPSGDVIPKSGELVDLLPGVFGDNTLFGATPVALKSAGLPERFAKLRSRDFVPSSDARQIPGVGKVIGASAPRGFGNVVALAPDVAQLQFDSPDTTRAFWEPIVGRLIRIPDPKNNANTYNSAEEGKRSLAMQYVMDLIGTIPGVGRFDFKYVAIVLCGLILVVGPVDYFVLRKAGRQPLTWLTTAGWIVVVTTAALLAGRWMKSGDLHLRTLRLVDQADGRVVGSSEVVCVYSPSTAAYDVAVDPVGWWRPAAPEQNYYRREPTASTMYFQQDSHGSRVASGALQINIWNLSFLEGRNIGTGDPVVEVTAQVAKGRESMIARVVNHSVGRLSGLSVRTRAGVWKSDQTVAAKESLDVTMVWDSTDTGATTSEDMLRQNLQYPQSNGATPAALRLESTLELSSERSAGALNWINSSDERAVFLAASSDMPGDVKLNGDAPREAHWMIVRSLLTLTPGEK